MRKQIQLEQMRKRMSDDEHHKKRTEEQERKAEERKRVLDDWYRNKFKQIQQIGAATGSGSEKSQSILKQQHQKRPGGRRLESLDQVIAQMRKQNDSVDHAKMGDRGHGINLRIDEETSEQNSTVED